MLYNWLKIRFFTFFVKANWQMAAALQIIFESGLWRAIFAKNKTLLIINSNAGISDIAEMISVSGGSYSAFYIDKLMFKIVLASFVGREIHDYDHRIFDSYLTPQKKACRSFFEGMLNYIKNLIGLDGIVTFNVNYRADAQLAFSASSIGIKFICIFKESNRTIESASYWIDYLSNHNEKFAGHLILPYNSISKKILVDSGVVDPDICVVIGCPRLDRSHAVRKRRSVGEHNKKIKKKIVYFLIQDNAGAVPSSVSDDWSRLRILFDQLVLESANLYPNIDFVVKAKEGWEKVQLQSFLNAPSNIHLDFNSQPEDLLTDCSGVLGFNTTALYEAIAAGVPVMSPEKLLTIDDDLGKYIHRFEKVGYTPRNIDEFFIDLENMVNSAAKVDLTITEKEFLMDKIGNADGDSTHRMLIEFNKLFGLKF